MILFDLPGPLWAIGTSAGCGEHTSVLTSQGLAHQERWYCPSLPWSSCWLVPTRCVGASGGVLPCLVLGSRGNWVPGLAQVVVGGCLAGSGGLRALCLILSLFCLGVAAVLQ
ncbi:hypothetical protein ATANTOWER_005990 [Ataeniobius toweri]|uniref:Uncharacterized protein n=1 Tax=Ataeniobius toweri TaxID=208326 RepID=A0ABU7CEW5_9TELE|nr:hypothetical protein [Ataeniobius toweri]